MTNSVDPDQVLYSGESDLGLHQVSGQIHVQSNLNSSNTDGLFTMVNLNLFLSPYENLPKAKENK